MHFYLFPCHRYFFYCELAMNSEGRSDLRLDPFDKTISSIWDN